MQMLDALLQLLGAITAMCDLHLYSGEQDDVWAMSACLCYIRPRTAHSLTHIIF